MSGRFDRLLHTGNVLVDLVVTVPRLPARGGDVLATGSAELTGGAFNVLAAASRLGLPTVYAGAHGTGPRGDRIRRDLAAEGVELAFPAHADLDTGFDVCLVDGEGERTFVTCPGAEARLSARHLAALNVTERDVVLVSGYSLAHDANRAALAPWLRGLAPPVTVVFDPGPLVGDLEPSALGPVLRRADWLTCNAAEAAVLTGTPDPVRAADLLRAPARGGVVVRTGPDGAVLATPRTPPVAVPPVAVAAVDTTGAGDAHTGAFVASLAAGADPQDAVRTANAAAAFAVTRRGPATGPTSGELRTFLATASCRPSPHLSP